MFIKQVYIKDECKITHYESVGVKQDKSTQDMSNFLIGEVSLECGSNNKMTLKKPHEIFTTKLLFYLNPD